MHKLRSLTVGFGALALVAAATAQFDGPAPLAWRWVQPTSVPPGGSPLVDHDIIYQCVGGRVFCIDKNSGNLKWRFPQLDPIDGTFRSTPIMADGSLLVVGDNKLAYAVDPTTGSLKWSANLPASAFGPPVVVGQYLVVALSDNSITTLKTTDGSPGWGDNPVYKISDGITGSIAASGPDVLVFTTRTGLIALNVERRAPDWQKTFTQLSPAPAAAVTNNSIYLNSGPYLISLNAATGNPRWQVPTQLQLEFAPVTSGDSILVVSQDGKAQAFNTITHEAINKIPIDLGSLPIVRPTAVGTKFVVLTSNGAINLIDPTKPDPQWIYVIHPLVQQSENSSSSGPSKGGPGFGGGGGAQGGNRPAEKITSVQASAPAVLAGQTLIVPAHDGSLLAFDKDLGVDLTPPAVQMLFPNPGDQVSGQPPLILVFKLTDEASGLRTDSIKVEINGQPLNFKLNRDGTVYVRFSLAGNTTPMKGHYAALNNSEWLGNRPMTDGRKEIVITASDWMGNEIKKSFSLSIDNTLRPIVLPGTETTTPGGGPPGGFGGGKGGGGGR